jgi:TonB family protein
LVSVVVHGVVAFGKAPPPVSSQRSLTTELVLAPPAPPTERPLPRASAPAKLVSEHRGESRSRIPLKPRAGQPPSAVAPEPLAAPPEPELTGRTLTAMADTSWSAPLGNGGARGPALGVGAASTLRATPSAGAAVPPPIPVTQPFAELSRKPAPPPLAAALQRNYPPAARRQGKSGEAKVRVWIDARGRAASVTVSSESSVGFGAACQRALLQSQWTPPLGPHGEPTATFVSYRCRFRVRD